MTKHRKNLSKLERLSAFSAPAAKAGESTEARRPILDLTRYGVEPNPGPKTKKTQKKVVKVVIPNHPSRKKKPAQRQRNKSFLSNLGGLVGSAVGGRSGAQMGRNAGEWFGRITGLGDYKVQRNTLLTNGNGPPLFGNPSMGTIITHREFLTDVVGSTAFTLNSLPINPGMSSTFPWLSNVAENYEQYELLGMVFEYKPTSAFAVSSTNTALGTVVFATDYDSYDNTFASKQQMEAYEFSTSSSPCNAMIHPIECSPKSSTLTKMYVRAGTPPTNADLRFYDMGLFQYATVGMQAAATIGELWVSYQVRLLKPKLPTAVGEDTEVAHFQSSPAGTATQANIVGTSGLVETTNTIRATVSASVITLPVVGRYFVSYIVNGATMTSSGSIGTFGANITTRNLLNDNTQYVIQALSGSTQAVSVYTLDVTLAGTGAANSLTFSGVSTLTAGNVDIFIISVPSSLTSRQQLRDSLYTRMSLLLEEAKRSIGTEIEQYETKGCGETRFISDEEGGSSSSSRQFEMRSQQLTNRIPAPSSEGTSRASNGSTGSWFRAS